VFPRLLGLPGGERHATDLRHLVELLHVEERRVHLSPARLAAWLADRAEEGGSEVEQRLESDAAAAKIETIHASKGLEYPVVLLPFAWTARSSRDQGAPRIVRDASRAALDLASKSSPERQARSVEHLVEQQAEELRKLYVALTRAKHRTVVWCGPVGDAGGAAESTAMGRLLFRDPEQCGHVGFPPPFDDKAQPGQAYAIAVERLDALVARSEGAVHWQPELAAPSIGAADRYVATDGTLPPDFVSAAWSESRSSVASPYRSTSFSALVRHGATHAPGAESGVLEAPTMPAEVEELSAGDELSTADEGDADEHSDAGLAGVDEAAPPRLRLGRGTDYGTWVHGVLEAIDFGTGRGIDGSDAMAVIERVARGVGLESATDQQAELGEVLPAILDTPLDKRGEADELGLPEGCSLRRIALADRVDELAFGLRLGDGAAYSHDAGLAAPSGLDARPGCVDPDAVYAALLDGAGPRGGAPSAWLEELRQLRRRGAPLVPSMTGLLEGSIDLVFRVRTPEGASRYYLADYKSNRIRVGTGEHYGQRAMDSKMSEAGYALQALVYTIALHRFLGARLRDYDYDRHVGGYLYLFLRGMAGPSTPRDPGTGRCQGVYAARFDAELVHALDEALLGRGALGQRGGRL
jgi:exodeoxyribonuclease V beta subunit